jgi:hypothetical protein
MKEQTEAARLADQLNAAYPDIHTGLSPAAAAELRRLDAENAKLQAEVRQLHLNLADSVLHAETGWSRYESANRMRNKLLEDSELHAMARANAGY